MTMIHNGVTADQDDSGSALTAAGAIKLTFSSPDVNNRKCTMVVMSRSDSAEYVPTLVTTVQGRYKINLEAGDQYYVNLENVDASNAIDVSSIASS